MTARHRIIRNWAEEDVHTAWRKLLGWNAGTRRWYKNRTNRRERRAAARDIRNEELTDAD